MVATLSSRAAPEVVGMTTSGAASDGKVVIMATLEFWCSLSLGYRGIATADIGCVWNLR